MAVIKYGAIVTSGSGSLGGSTLQAGHSAPIWRNKPQQTFSRTQSQSIIRGYNKTMQAGWRELTSQQHTIWNNFAQLKPVFNRSGEKHHLSGHSLWMKYQFAYLSNLLPLQSDPFKASVGPFGPEIIVNGSFDNSVNWILSANWTISGGKAHYDALLSNTIAQNWIGLQLIDHHISFDISNCPGIAEFIFYSSIPSGWLFESPLIGKQYLSNGSYFFNAQAKTTGLRLLFRGYPTNDPFSLDNLSIREILY